MTYPQGYPQQNPYGYPQGGYPQQQPYYPQGYPQQFPPQPPQQAQEWQGTGNPLGSGTKRKSISWGTLEQSVPIGTYRLLLVYALPKVFHDRDFMTGEPKFYPNSTNPMWKIVFGVVDEQGEECGFFMGRPSAMQAALLEAEQESGQQIDYLSLLYVTLVGFKEDTEGQGRQRKASQKLFKAVHYPAPKGFEYVNAVQLEKAKKLADWEKQEEERRKQDEHKEGSDSLPPAQGMPPAPPAPPIQIQQPMPPPASMQSGPQQQWGTPPTMPPSPMPMPPPASTNPQSVQVPGSTNPQQVQPPSWGTSSVPPMSAEQRAAIDSAREAVQRELGGQVIHEGPVTPTPPPTAPPSQPGYPVNAGEFNGIPVAHLDALRGMDDNTIKMLGRDPVQVRAAIAAWQASGGAPPY